MNSLKVCFIGVGSIAKRHIRNLQEICEKQGIDILIDAFRRKPESVEGVSTVYCDVNAVPTDYDAIFITNPTSQHLNALETFHGNSKHFFIEKPVVSLNQIDEAEHIKRRTNSIYYVAAPLRYNAVIRWIKDNIRINDVISVRSISSSYLPEWRPGQDYRNTYSAHKDMGGGVSIDLIHEWDYLTYLFGFPEKVQCMIGRKSDLEIDSEDYAIYIAEYENMIAELHLDYFGRKTIREIELFTKHETIIGNIAENRIELLNESKLIQFDENRNSYQKRELQYFIDMIFGRIEMKDGFSHALNVLEITQGKGKGQS